MRPAALLALALALSACSSGPQETTGVISDLAGRLCVQTAIDDGTCFTTTPDQLVGLQPGSCVTVSFEASNGVLGRATAVRPAPDGCGA